MSDYLNRASMTVYLTMAAVNGTCHELLNANCSFRNGDRCRELLEQIQALSRKCVEIIDEGLDGDALAGALKRSSGMQMVCVSEADPKVGTAMGYYVEPTDMETLISGAMGPCLFCDQKGQDVRGCEVRKALLRSGVPTLSTGAECPFAR